MRKLVLVIVAVLALFTFIREYSAPSGRGVEQVKIEHALPN